MPLSHRPEQRARQLANLRDAPPPTPIGNTRAVSHGGFAKVAPERLEKREREIYEALSADLPLRGPDGAAPSSDALAVSLLAEALCRLDSVRNYLAERDIADAKGRLRPGVEVEAKLRREAMDYAEALGLTPRGRMKLGLDLARGIDLAAQWAKEPDEALDAEAEEVAEDG